MSPPTPAAPPATPSARRPLRRRRVLQAALDFVDDYGLAGLAMRRLATELDVEAGSRDPSAGGVSLVLVSLSTAGRTERLLGVVVDLRRSTVDCGGLA